MARNVVNFPKELNTTSWLSNANLKAYYRFVNGSELNDTTTNAHTLTAIGVPVQSIPKFGGAVGIGTSQAFSAVDGADFQPSGNFSISAWVRTTETTGSKWIFQSYAQPSKRAGTYLCIDSTPSAGTVKFLVGKNTGLVAGTDDKSISSTATVTNGAWHYVVATWDGTNINLYIDGASAATPVAAFAPVFAATNYVRVGCINTTGSNSAYFQGSLSEVLFFNGTALSLAQVQSLSANSINHISNAAILADANLKAIYLFADGAQLTDSTANAHTLTAIGTPTTLTTKFEGSVFLGNSSAYSAVDHADFQPTGNFTVGAWIKQPATGAYNVIFSTYSQNTNFAGVVFAIAATNRLTAFSGKNTGTTANVDYKSINADSVIADNTWHFAVLTWDGSYLRIYKDGVSDATAVSWANAPAYAATNYVRVGAQCNAGSNSSIFSGQLDDVFLLNGTALTDAQIAYLYNGRTVLTYPRTPGGGVYIPGAKSIEGATGDTARTTDGWIENEKYGWYAKETATAWSAEFDTAVTRTGTKTLKLSCTDTAGRVDADPAPSIALANLKKYCPVIKPSTSYTFSVYAKGTNVKNQQLRYIDCNVAGGLLTNSAVGNAYSGTFDWTLITFTVTSAATAFYAFISLRNALAGNISDIWFDVNSLTLTEVKTRTVLTYPRIPLGGVYIPGAKSIEASTGDTAATVPSWIEDQKYKWYVVPTPSASAEFDTAVTRTGTKTLKLSTSDATGKGYFVLDPNGIAGDNLQKYCVLIKPNTSYTVNLWVKTTTVAADSVYYTFREVDASGGTVVSNESAKLTGTNDWTLLSITATTGATTKYARFILRMNVAGDAQSSWFDVNSMTLIETAAA